MTSDSNSTSAAAAGEAGELRVADFDFDLPPALIAQTPLANRADSRLLVVDRATATLSDSVVRELGHWLEPGDLLVANNSKVIPARLHGQRQGTGGRVEFLLLGRLAAGRWEALARPARRLRRSSRVVLNTRSGAPSAIVVTVLEQRSDGVVELELPAAVEAQLAAYGSMPLPPYIGERLEDDERYQTVYARHFGSAAAPTAGLHFTPELIASLRRAGIHWAEVTLHIGLDTFRPVTVERVADHVMHSERFTVEAGVLAQIQATKRAGRRVIAIGTTSARTLESVGAEWDWQGEDPRDIAGPTSIFIVPGYRWSIVDGLFTNFHLPRSTLLMMVSSLAGKPTIERAYAHAIAQRYRFFSFGDAMLIR